MSAARHPLTSLPASVPAAFRGAIVAATDAWSVLLGPRLISAVLFGSVARGTSHRSSDIDLLIIAEGFPRSLSERRRLLLAEWARVQASNGLAAVDWNLVTKTPDEARCHSPLYLDIVEDGVLLIDRDQFFQSVLDAMRARMRELGCRRIFLEDGSWYWDLKPDFRFGEVVEI